MSDFTINIDSKLDLSKAKSEMDSFINSYKNSPLQIRVELDPKSINTANFGKQIQSSFSNAGSNAGKAFTKNMESSINSTNINKLIDRLNAKGISKDIVSGAEKSLNTLTKAGIQIKKIHEVFSGDNLISLKIEGIDKGENAVSILDKLNKKTKEWVTTTTYTTSFKDVAKDAENAKSKLLSLEEIKTRLFKAQGNVGSLQAKFGNVDKFSQDFNELGISIKNALSQADNGDASQLSSILAEIEGKVKTLTTVTREWRKVNQTDADITSSTRKQLEDTEKAINKQKELQSALNAFRKQNVTLFDPKSENYSSSIVAEFNEVENAINRISSVSSAKVASNMFSGLRASVKTATEGIKTEATELEKIQDKFKTAQSNFNSIQYAFGKSSQSILGTNGYSQIQTYLNQATSAAERFNAEIKQGESANLDSLNADMKEFISLTNKATSEYNKLNSPASAIKQQNTLNDFLRWGNSNSKALKVAGLRYDSIVSSLKGNLTGGQLEEAISQIKTFKTEMELSGNIGRSFSEEIGRGFKKIGQFAYTYGAIQRIPEYAMKAAKAVLEVDTSMTELRKVSNDYEDAQINQYFDHATESAKKYGAAINEVINSASDWKRLGYGLSDAEKLADVTTLLQKVGDNMTQESASSGLVSTLKGFQKSADEAKKIVDAANAVSNTQPIATDGLFSALERSASSMNAANNSLEQTIGLITAANSVVQDADSVGTAFKTISMRIRGASTELQDAGLDAEGMAESTAKLREEIIALSGVDIMIDDNNFKSTYDILDELSQKWSDLTDIQQASITELIAGKRQGNIVSALMTNFDIAREATQTAMNADGSSEKELSNYQQSIQYSLDKMKATAQEFANVTLDSSWLKAGVDTAQTLLEVLTQIEKFTGIIPLIFGGTAVVKAIKNFDRSNDFVLYGCESMVA